MIFNKEDLIKVYCDDCGEVAYLSSKVGFISGIVLCCDCVNPETVVDEEGD